MNNKELDKAITDIQNYIKGDCFGVDDLRYEMSLVAEWNRRELEWLKQ